MDAPSGTTTDLGVLDYQVRAAGYSASQDLIYGIATHDKLGWLLRRPQLVTVDRRGTLRTLGPVRYGIGGIAEPTAGAATSTRLYVRDVHRLYTMDIDPRSTSYQSVLKVVWLSQLSLATDVDDFAADPSTGLLYGISTFGHVAKVVSLDPRSGAVRVIATVPGAPWQDSYSSVVVGSSELYAVHTGHGRRSQLFRIGFDGSSEELSSWKPLARSDAAGCLKQVVQSPPPPPPTPTPTPTPTQQPSTPPPSPRPTTTPTGTAAPPPPPPDEPGTPRPTQPRTTAPSSRTPTPMMPQGDTSAPVRPPQSVPPTEPPTRPPSAAPSTPVVVRAAPRVAAVPAEEDDRTVQVLRRWSLAMLLVILISGAAMAAQRRMRQMRR